MAECGTNAGYQAHRKRGEPACEACRTASRTYQRSWNARHPGQAAAYKDTYKRTAAIRDRAIERLVREYPERFMELYYEEENVAACEFSTTGPPEPGLAFGITVTKDGTVTGTIANI